MIHDIYPIQQEVIPISLGGQMFYVTSWRLRGTRVFSQQNDITGSPYVTNSGTRARELELNGSFGFTGQPSGLIASLDNALANKTYFQFVLAGIRYNNAFLTEYEIKQQMEDSVLPCKLILTHSNRLYENVGGGTAT